MPLAIFRYDSTLLYQRSSINLWNHLCLISASIPESKLPHKKEKPNHNFVPKLVFSENSFPIRLLVWYELCVCLHNILTIKQVTLIQSSGSRGLALLGSVESRKPLKHLSIEKLYLNTMDYAMVYGLWMLKVLEYFTLLILHCIKVVGCFWSHISNTS